MVSFEKIKGLASICLVLDNDDSGADSLNTNCSGEESMAWEKVAPA
jgi:hypothetical protein